MAFDEDVYDGNPQYNASMMAFDATRNKPYPVEGVVNGTRIVLLTSPAVGLGSGRKITQRDDIAVVAGGPVINFELTVDADGDALPTDMEVVSLQVYPHNGATPKVAVSTIWTLKLFSHSNRFIDQIVRIDDRTNIGASSDPVINNSRWDYINEEGDTEIVGTLEIPGGASNATFTVKAIFR